MALNNFLNIQDTKKYYLNNIALYGLDAPRTMGYRSGPVDDRLISNLLPDDVCNSYSVLDIGCGLGQIIPILQGRFPNYLLEDLVGIDLVDEFIESCKLKYINYDFYVSDFLEWNSPRMFDVVIAAGVLVTRIADFENYLLRFIEKMTVVSKDWIAFNLVNSCGLNYTAKHLATISLDDIMKILAQIPNVNWEIELKEVFPGSKDAFIRGRKIYI